MAHNMAPSNAIMQRADGHGTIIIMSGLIRSGSGRAATQSRPNCPKHTEGNA